MDVPNVLDSEASLNQAAELLNCRLEYFQKTARITLEFNVNRQAQDGTETLRRVSATIIRTAPKTV